VTRHSASRHAASGYGPSMVRPNSAIRPQLGSGRFDVKRPQPSWRSRVWHGTGAVMRRTASRDYLDPRPPAQSPNLRVDHRQVIHLPGRRAKASEPVIMRPSGSRWRRRRGRRASSTRGVGCCAVMVGAPSPGVVGGRWAAAGPSGSAGVPAINRTRNDPLRRVRAQRPGRMALTRRDRRSEAGRHGLPSLSDE